MKNHNFLNSPWACPVCMNLISRKLSFNPNNLNELVYINTSIGCNYCNSELKKMTDPSYKEKNEKKSKKKRYQSRTNRKKTN